MFPVETFQATLGKLTRILYEHGIRFHLTGGLTGTAYGEPRMTQDIDVVIDPIGARSKTDQLVRSIEESDFMFNEDAWRWQSKREPPWQPKTEPGGVSGGDLGVPVL